MFFRKTNRGRGTIGLLLLAAALTLAACGGNDKGKNGNQTASPAAATTEASPSASAADATPAPSSEAPAATRKFTDALGREVEIPSQPQRIVGHFFGSELAALEAPMVATNFINAAQVLTEEQLQGVADIAGNTLAPDPEKTLSVEPDLIIVPDFLEAGDLESLSQIAPTVVVSYSAETFERLRLLGDIVGKPEAAESWVEAYNAKVDATREKLKGVVAEGETATAFVLYNNKELFIYGTQRLGPTLYDAIGFKRPDKAVALFEGTPDELWKTISMETLPDYAGDRIFFIAPEDTDESKQAYDEMRNSPIWKNLPAVKNGKAYLVAGRWAFNDPMTLSWMLDDAVKVLTGQP